jgi:hypothetical protein
MSNFVQEMRIRNDINLLTPIVVKEDIGIMLM